MTFNRLWAQARSIVWLAVIAVLAAIAAVLVAILFVPQSLALVLVGVGIILAILAR